MGQTTYFKFLWARVIAVLVLCAASLPMSVHADGHGYKQPIGTLRQVQYAPPRATPAQVHDFKQAMAIVLNRMMNSYASAIKEPIRVDLVDITQQKVDRFVKDTGYDFDPNHPMQLSYYRSIRINSKETSACLLLFNPDADASALSGFEGTGFFTKKDIVYYLAAHEFGHCMGRHEETLGRNPKLSNKEHELMADKVAITFFLVNGFPESAARVVRFNREWVTGDLHHHPEELNEFLLNAQSLFRSLGPERSREYIKDMRDVYLYSIGKLPN